MPQSAAISQSVASAAIGDYGKASGIGRERNPAAGLFRSQGTVVVKAYTDGHGDSFRAVSGPHEERVPELVCRSRLSHNRERETAEVQCMSRAAGHAHDTAQTFLNERERVALDIDRRGPVSAVGY